MEERKKAKSPAKGGVGVTGGSNSTTQLPPAFRFIKNADFIYQCRKPLFTLGKDPSMFHEFSESTYTLQDVNHESDLLAFESITAVKEKVISEEDKLEHLLSRRKVAKALLGMSLNGKMVEYFVTAGGIDAVYRLIRESEDMEVLSTCSACILHITTLTRFIVCLLNSHLLANVISLIEQGNEEIRHHCARSLAQISSTSASDVSLSEQSFQTLVITSGLMMALQMLFNKCKRNDSLTFSLLSLCNISPSISEVSDTEVSVRLVIIATKRLDILSDYESALLLSEVLKNLSRLAQFNYLLCEEGILLVLLALIDQFINKLEIVASCTEAIVNFSMNVKNRRKLVASGLHSRLIPIFALESPSVSTNLLLMIGNLLRVGIYHDKMAKEDLVVMVFEMLRFQLDGKSNDEESAIDSVPQGTVFNDRLKQFLAAAYCAAELASVPATAELIVKCGVVRLVLDILHHIHQQNLSKQKPSAEECENNSKLNGHHSPVLNREAEVEVMTSLWSILATLSLNPMYLHSIISCPLLPEVVKTESELGLSACRIKLSQLLLEISKDVADKDFAVHPELASNLPGLIAAVRHLLAHPMGRDASDIACENGDFLQVITLSLHSLVYFAKGVPSSRTQILGTDLLELLRSAVPNNELQGRQETFLVIMLLYLLSTEESLAIRLLDADLHGLIVGHGSFLEAVSIKAKSTQKSVHDGRKVALVQNFGDYSKMKEMHFIRRSGDLLAATCLNLAIKRGTLGDGILPMLLSLFKNCKSSRVMWIARCLSYVSAHPRAKGLLIKEPRLVGILTGVMRNGNEEAERTQLYCARVLCNLLAQPLPQAYLQQSISCGEVIDLIVVTLLRVSAHCSLSESRPFDNSASALSMHTKESLGRALFNLLSPAELRGTMVGQGVFEALLDLSKLESIDILDLSMRAVYNITCETSAYFAYILKANVPSALVAILSYSQSATHTGARPSHKIKLICTKAAANMSFHPDIAFALAKCSSLSDALHCMVNLGSQEAVYCAVALMHNLFIPDFDDTPRAHIVTLAASTVLNGSLKYGNAGEKESQTVVNILVGILKSLVNTTATPLLVGQLAVSTLCNLALLPSFHSQLSIHAMEPIITTLTSPRCNLDIKIDAVRFLYNLVTSASCFESKSLAIDAGAVPGILSILKLMTPEDNPTICLLGSILVEISSVGSLNQRMVQEGVSKAIIRLAKVEIPSVKQDIARAFFRLCLSPDGASRMLAMGDSVDALFWLTLHDCLGEFGPILSNVSRTLKNLSLTSEDCVLLANQDRLMNVLNVLSRCEKEDILWHTAAAIFNMLKVESIRHVLTKGGIVPIIFRLAGAGGGSGFVPVRFLCSASLHMIPDSLPDMADPAVLPLVLCILETNEGNHSKDDPEAQTMDEVSSLPTRSSDPDAWQLSKSGFCHSQRCFDFENSPGAEVMPPLNWMTLVCDVELTFSPVVLNILGSEDVKFLSTSCAEEERLSAMSKPMSVIGTHLKLSGAMFGDFKGELSRAERQSRPADENMVAVVKRGASKPEIGAAAVETALMDSNANRTPSRNESRRPQSFGSPVRSLPSLAVSRASTSPMNTVSLLQKSAYSPVSRPRTGSSQQSTRSKARSFSKRK